MGNSEDELVLEFAISNGRKKKVRRNFEGQTHKKDFITYLSPTGEEVTDMAEYLSINPESSALQFEPTGEIVTQAGCSLPLELVRFICCRLPDRELARFATTHTSWRDMIRDPSFISMHARLGVCDLTTLVVEGHSTQLGSRYYLIGENGDVMSLIDNQWETMCLKGSIKSNILLTSREKKESTLLIIFDSATMSQKELPSVKGGYYDLILGYDSVESDLKVCRIFCENNVNWIYDILSVNKGKWGRIRAFSSAVLDVHLPALVREEKAHYLIISAEKAVFLMSVDLTSQEYTLNRCPDCTNVMWSQLVLIHRNLSLCTVNDYTTVSISFFQDNGWIKSFVISLTLDDEVSLVRRNMNFFIPPLDLDNNLGVVMRNELRVYPLTTRVTQVPRATLILRVPWATSLTPWKVESCFLQRTTPTAAPTPIPTLSLTAGEEKAEEEEEEEEEEEVEEMGEEEVFELEI